MSFRNEFPQMDLKESRQFLQIGLEKKDSLLEEKAPSHPPAPIQVSPLDEKEFTKEEIQQYSTHILEALAEHPYVCSIIKKALLIRNLEKITVLLYKDTRCCNPRKAYDNAFVSVSEKKCTITTIVTTDLSDLIDRVTFELCNSANDLLCAITDKERIEIIRMGPEFFAKLIEEGEYKTWKMMSWIMKTCPKSIYWVPTFQSCFFFQAERYPDWTFDEYWQNVNKKVYFCCGESHKSRYEEQWKKLVYNVPLEVLLLVIFIEDDHKCLKDLSCVYKMEEVLKIMKEYQTDYQFVFNIGQSQECLKLLLSCGYVPLKLSVDMTPEFKLSKYITLVKTTESDDEKQKDAEYKSFSSFRTHSV